MPKLAALTGALLVLTAAQSYARDESYAVPFEVGQRVEITLAKSYRTAEGVRIDVPWTRLDGKETLTLRAGGHTKELVWQTEPGRVQGRLTEMDDTWLTVDLGGGQPFLRIPRDAIVRIARWENLGLLPQGSEPLSADRRVRLLSTELGTQAVTGHLLAIGDETLLVRLAEHGEPVRLQRSSIVQMEVSRGTRSRAGRGALIGALSLGVPLAALGAAFCVECDHPDHVAGAEAGLIVGGLFGAGVGAMIGSNSKAERWERAPLSIAVAPQRRGARAALTLRF